MNMRCELLKKLLWFATLITFLVIILYFLNFHEGVSKSSSDWADFGAYVGGVLGPLYAFLAFVGLLETIRQSSLQRELKRLLVTIDKLEKDFDYWISLSVTCDGPWIWGNKPHVSSKIQEVSFRTLLQSDGIDWEFYLEDLRDSLKFRFQKNGVLYQDRDIWLKAKVTITSLFACLEKYKQKGGEDAIYKYYYDSYDIARNRLQDSDRESVGQI